ncbi:leucine rich adaptor protein 1-like isoform X2 [Hyla sarda]|uniref:leucine rich adaptor protein 1-like isoform X2 n=1 Tax=Hyla sarda TaxID=327740 RepID=UPI0024C28DBC|nr:leucine rich adaptor protein 1-like isoform X2 [Hyla sarda]
MQDPSCQAEEPQLDSWLDLAVTYLDAEDTEQIFLRAADVKLMRQLLIINENIESIKYMMEEKDIVTSQGSSLSGSLCSLLESRDSSLQGSYTSLHGYSDGMDEISVGSYLDTLGDIVPGHCTPDFDQCNDVQQNSEDYQPLCNDSNRQYDEYYCFR